MKDPAHTNPSFIIPFGMFVFGVALTLGCFWYEARPQQEKLTSLLTNPTNT
jgi:hypothetical protein